MATSQNLGLYLPTRDDYISVKRDISDNMEIIDEAVGANTSGVSNIDSGLAYVAVKVGNNWQMPSGKTAQINDFVIVNGVFGHATAILTGGSTNIVENTNWVAETTGGLNWLNTAIAAINGKLILEPMVASVDFNHTDTNGETYTEFQFNLSSGDSLGYVQYLIRYNHKAKQIHIFGKNSSNQYTRIYAIPAISVEATANTTTSLPAGAITAVTINVAKTGKQAIGIVGVMPYYPNSERINYFSLDLANQTVTVYLENTSNSALTGVSVSCLYQTV